MDINVLVKNLDRLRKYSHNFAIVSILYDNNYEYISSPVFVEKDGSFSIFYNEIQPLQYGQIHYIIEVPNVVKTSSKSIVIIIRISDKEFRFRYR